jgi:drug/metabolite transporter (DMT)-like permease
MPPKSLPYLALAFAIFTWGLSPVFVRSLALVTGPADSIIIRMWSVAIICIPLLAYSGFKIARADIPNMLIAGVIGMFGYFVGTIFGYARLNAGVGGIIGATQPLLIALLAAAMGIEKLRMSVIIGILISFAGTIYLFGGTNSNIVTDQSSLIIGGLLIFFSGACWAVYVVVSKPLIEKYGTLKITAYSLILCGPPSLVFASSSTLGAAQKLGAQDWASLFFLSVIATFIALILWNYAVGRLKSSTVGASLYLVPLLTILAGWMLLDEALTISTLMAGAIILLGVAVAQFGSQVKQKSLV